MSASRVLLEVAATLAATAALSTMVRGNPRAGQATSRAASFAPCVDRRVVGMFLGLGAFAVAFNMRVATFAMDDASCWIALTLAVEFLHRCMRHLDRRAERIWIDNVVRPSSVTPPLPVVMRYGLTSGIGGRAMFFAPLALVGFPPIAVIEIAILNAIVSFACSSTRRVTRVAKTAIA